MRSKEEAHDYRYFPDPDLKPLILTSERIDELRSSSFQSYNKKLTTYTVDYKLSKDDSEILLSNKILSKFFDDTLRIIKDPKLVCKWSISEIIKYINLDSFALDVKNFANFSLVLKEGKINNNSGKELLEKISTSNDDIEILIDSMDLKQESSEDLLEVVIEEALLENPNEKQRLLEGEDKLISFFMGQVMKKTKGKGNPGIIIGIIKEKFNIS
jgi:aspartyl-tRNA(Asn)/glutamyl-tRNA(Gln) amidotransferase subunit B